MKYLFVVLGGGIGALLRYLSVEFIKRIFDTPFPVGTFAVNIIGSLLIGFLFTAFETRLLPDQFRLFAITGFLGGYTTFSAYSLETTRYLLNGDTRLALANVLLSNLLCVSFTFAGMKLAKMLMPAP
ncbi:MAG: fluoride efflux transporter CrcB [Spirochaetaceae bacterium]|jgi:CrcB protein|nr:fluoride efflux transporter CrcB [Spirochaetaceae bacterium]